MKIELSDKIRIKKTDLPAYILERIKTYLTIKNAKYEENEKRGYSNHQTPQYVYGYTEDDDYIYAHRGYMGSFYEIQCAIISMNKEFMRLKH